MLERTRGRREDASTATRKVRPPFHREASRKGRTPMLHSRPLSDEHVESFFEQGFVLLPDVFAPADIAQMRAAFERLLEMAATLGDSGMHRGSQFVLERAEASSHAVSYT